MRITERCGCGASIEVANGVYDDSHVTDAVAAWHETHRHESRSPAAPPGDDQPPVGTVASQTDLAEPTFGFSGSDVVIAREGA